MDNENNFVMSHAVFLMGRTSRDADAVRQGLNLNPAAANTLQPPDRG